LAAEAFKTDFDTSIEVAVIEAVLCAFCWSISEIITDVCSLEGSVLVVIDVASYRFVLFGCLANFGGS